jgi:hypothetical protein
MLSNGLPHQDVTNLAGYVSADCSGDALVGALTPSPDGLPAYWAVSDSTAPDGKSYYEASTPDPPTTVTINSFGGIAFGFGCTPFSWSGSFTKLVLGAKVQRPPLPLSPVVVP